MGCSYVLTKSLIFPCKSQAPDTCLSILPRTSARLAEIALGMRPNTKWYVYAHCNAGAKFTLPRISGLPSCSMGFTVGISPRIIFALLPLNQGGATAKHPWTPRVLHHMKLLMSFITTKVRSKYFPFSSRSISKTPLLST